MNSRSLGYLHWIFAAMIGIGALDVLLSGRDLSRIFLALEAGYGGGQHPIMPWIQRLVSVLLLVAVTERVSNHFRLGRHMPSPALTAAYLLYWTCTVALTAFFGTHRQISHEYLYTLALGGAVLLASSAERDRIIDMSRDALYILILAGLVLIPIQPSLVMDTSYSQGLIPGLPRHGGLAPHPVALGMFAQTFLLLTWYRPYRHSWLNWVAWAMGLTVLFIAQSKNAWIAFALCTICMLAVRNGSNLWRRLGDPRDGAFGIIVCLLMMVVVVALAVFLLAFGMDVDDVFDSAQGAQLMSMTGRDRIWEIAIEEWQNNRMFGYGPSLWDDAFRASINMPNATNAHNQFMDTLARSGTIGAVSLVIYGLTLLVLSIKYARPTGGLSLALFIALALRSITEVPMLLLGYGYELFAHLLLLVTIAGAAASWQPRTARQQRTIYGVAS
ncbi:MAG TPA: O-antigen ligase family protein [Ramlibacter sp.]|nr:O-antigen ligase family protein [Ramlibacter sp.]